MKTNILSLIAVLATACTAELEPAAGSVAERSDALYGEFDFDGDCSSADQTLVKRSTAYGRIASASVAFRQCVNAAMTVGVDSDNDFGPYMACVGEPFWNRGRARQFERVLAAAQSPNDLDVGCTGAERGAAWASIGAYATTGVEEFDFNDEWFDRQLAKVGDPCLDDVCIGAENLRPYADVAGTVWHEAMHQQGYEHGDNRDEDFGARECGWSPSAGYRTYVNDMPTIVGNCIEAVLIESARQCDLAACGRGGLMLQSGWRASTCECVEDPNDNGIGLIGFDATGFDDIAMSAYNENLDGGFYFSHGEHVSAAGNFTGDARDQLLLVGDNVSIAAMYDGRIHALSRVDVGGTMGTWTLTAGDSFVGAGRIDGTPGDPLTPYKGLEIVVRGSQGLGILTSTNMGELRALYEIPNGTLFVKPAPPGGTITESWTLAAADTVRAVDDFTLDGREDILLTSSNNFVVLTRTAFGFIQVAATLRPGHVIGSWRWSVEDSFVASGDFNGDGRADLLVKGNEGLGVFTIAAGAFTLVARLAIDAAAGGWVLSSRDAVVAIGDFDGVGPVDLLIRSSAQLGVLRVRLGRFESYLRVAMNTIVPGGYRIELGDRIYGAGDFDGNGTDDVIVTDDWGFAVLRTDGGVLATLARHPFRDTDPDEDDRPTEWSERSVSMLGSWPLNSTDRPVYHAGSPFDPVRNGIGDFDGDGRVDFAIRR